MKKIIQTGIAFIMAFLVMNMICLLWNYYPKTYSSENNYSQVVLEPGSKIISSREGFTILNVDSHGYVNENLPLSADGYILICGSSMVEGAQVLENKRYSALLNSRLTGKDELVVYNMGRSGYSYLDIIKGFPSIVREFPESKAIVIDVMNGNFTIEDVWDSLNAREYSEADLAENINWDNLGIRQSIRTVSPFLYNLWLKIALIKPNKTSIGFYRIQEKNELDDDDNSSNYYEPFVATMEYMKSIYDEEIIIAYHPDVFLAENGTLEIVKNNFVADMKMACEKTGIIWVDCSKQIEQEYKSEQRLPYGFNNTSFGGGAHLNETGHRIMADTLYPYLEEIIK